MLRENLLPDLIFYLHFKCLLPKQFLLKLKQLFLWVAKHPWRRFFVWFYGFYTCFIIMIWPWYSASRSSRSTGALASSAPQHHEDCQPFVPKYFFSSSQRLYFDIASDLPRKMSRTHLEDDMNHSWLLDCCCFDSDFLSLLCK